MKEIWKDADGYDGLYQVSNLGRFRSFDRKMWCPLNGGFYVVHKGRILKQSNDKDGYKQVGLTKNGKVKTCRVHQFVAKAFLPNPNNYPVINHKDENKANNFVYINDDGSVDFEKSNLEWCTIKYNTNYGNARSRAAEHCFKPVLQYSLEGELIGRYSSLKEAGWQFRKNKKVAASHICQCCSGATKTAYGYIWKREEQI